MRRGTSVASESFLQVIDTVTALDEALLEAARRVKELKDHLAEHSGVVLPAQYVVFDTENPRGFPASQERVTQLRRNYRRFCILLDAPRSRCYSRFRRAWVIFGVWQRALAKWLIANAGSEVSGGQICEVVKASTLREHELAAKKVSILRASLGLPGSGKEWQFIRTVSGEGYEFIADGPYCLIDYGGQGSGGSLSYH